MSMQKGNTILDKFVPVLLIVTIGLAFAVGVLWQKVQNLESGKTVTSVANNQAAGQPPTNGKLTPDQAKKVAPVSDSDHIRGSKDAKVFLIEYSDLQCPFCKAFHPTAKQVVDQYKGQVAWVYRHFPLTTIHPKAEPSAEASECVAHLSGEDAFWSFIDKVFERQPESLDQEPAIATGLGVNKSDFTSCVAAAKYKSVVDADTTSGSNAGVNGTPTSFVVNKKGEVWIIPGAIPFESLKGTIDEVLK